jgi:hypothetical protein
MNNKLVPYGYCPICHAKGLSRERRPNGNDKCINGHTYPSSSSMLEASPQVDAEIVGYRIVHMDGEYELAFRETWQKVRKQEPLYTSPPDTEAKLKLAVEALEDICNKDIRLLQSAESIATKALEAIKSKG